MIIIIVVVVVAVFWFFLAPADTIYAVTKPSFAKEKSDDDAKVDIIKYFSED